MFLDSFAFWIFFTLVIALLMRFPKKRLGILLITSLIFYTFLIKKLLIVFFSHSVFIFWLAQLIDKHRTQKGVIRFNLIAGIVSNITLLVLFKYAGLRDFFVSNEQQIMNLQSYVFTETVIWIGISFYILRSLSFLFDVFKKLVQPVGTFKTYLLYMSFFPLAIAGPIEKARDFMRSVKRFRSIGWTEIKIGSQLILWGIFKKAVIADNVGVLVKEVFNNSSHYNGLVLLIGLYFYSFQIYFDFSGYSDIASGLSHSLGFSITQNFKSPYFARSVIDFWQRWHISFTKWLREYVYIFLGGNRVKTVTWVRNILIVFFISGLWHGMKITFLLWAMLHAAVYMITSYMARKRIFESGSEKISFGQSEKLMNKYFWILNKRDKFNVFLTFNLITLFWLPFRADSLSHAWQIFSRIVYDILIGPFVGHFQLLTLINSGFTKRYLLMWGILIVLALSVEQMRKGNTLLPKTAPTWLKWSILYVLIFGLLFYSQTEPMQFIYAQF